MQLFKVDTTIIAQRKGLKIKRPSDIAVNG